jgi:hypothetical protein
MQGAYLRNLEIDRGHAYSGCEAKFSPICDPSKESNEDGIQKKVLMSFVNL